MAIVCYGNTFRGLSAISVLLCLELSMAADHPFEAPSARAQTVPRPFDGERVAANPPCFVYPAVRHFEAYVVEYSRSPTFAADTTQVLTGKWMLNVPPESLAPGRWHWRWRPGKGGDGTAAWSSSRSFTVPADVPVVPFPSILTLVQRLGTRHPRVLVTPSGLEAMRGRALATLGKQWRDGVDRYAEAAARKELLSEPDPLPRGKPEYLSSYVRTFARYRPFFAEMTTLGENYLLTGDELSGREAKRRLLSIVAWDPEGSTSLHHNDEVGTDVVRHCPRTYDWIHPLLTPQERVKCLAVLQVRMQHMFDLLRKLPFEKHPYESHRMGYYLPDLLQACLAVSGDLDVSQMLHYAMLQLWSPFYPPYGDADGGWNEGPMYWGWMAGVCAHTYTLVERATGIPVHLRSSLRNQPFYKLYGNPPWFKMSPFGDAQEKPAKGGDAMLMLSSLYRNPYAKWYGEQLGVRLNGMSSLLFPVDEVRVAPPRDLPQGRCFFDVGLSCSHTNLSDGNTDVVFLMRSCPFGGYGHAYADQNTFVLDAFGEPLIIASGYYQQYGCKHHTQWTWQTMASNSILVNSKGQPRNWDAKGRIAEFASVAAADYIVGDARRAYPNMLTRYDRRAVFLRPMHTGGGAVIVMHDDIEADEPSTFQFLLHALNRMDLDDDAGSVMIRQGKAACRVDLLAPGSLDFQQDNKFTAPPVNTSSPDQWHFKAGTTELRSTVSSALTLQPCLRGDEARLMQTGMDQTATALAVTLTDENRRVVVLYRTDATTDLVEAGGVRTDGHAASVAFVGERVLSATVFGGTFVEASGKCLIRSESKGSISSTSVSDGQLIEATVNEPGRIEVAVDLRAVRAVDEAGASLSVELGETAAIAFTRPSQLVRLEARSRPDHVAKSARLCVPNGPTARFAVSRHPRIGQTNWSAEFPGPPGIWRLGLKVAAARGGPYPLTLRAGSGSVPGDLPGGENRTLEIPACSLDYGDPITLSCDRDAGGTVRIVSAEARRAYGANLFPNPSFEDTADGVPVGYRAQSITRGAQCRIEAADGGHSGERGLRVVCTDATGGDFGVALKWPGVKPVAYKRRFRLSCRVRTGSGSRAGIQVTNREWQFTQTTNRLADASEWTETARELTLPAGENLTHARLHMSAQRVGAELLADDVCLVELPASECPTDVPQVPLCMVGDSITWWGDGDYWREYLLAEVPQLAFVGTYTGKLGYSHAGEGGNSTGNVLARLDAIPACPYYSLLIGTNNNNVGTEKDIQPRARQTSERIERIVSGLLNKPGVHNVFLGSILPCKTDNPLRDRTNAATNALLRESMASMSAKGRVVWVEYEKPIRALPGWEPIIRLHPTEEGYKVLARILGETMRTALDIAAPGPSPRARPGAGVRVDNLWEGGPDGRTRVRLIAGWYTVSFRVMDRAGKSPAIALHGVDVRGAHPFHKTFRVAPNAVGTRSSFSFYTGVEGGDYSRSKFALDCRDCQISDILIEKMRPSRKASVYGSGAYIDTESPPSPGEVIEYP